jgi:hypothetical protein
MKQRGKAAEKDDCFDFLLECTELDEAPLD